MHQWISLFKGHPQNYALDDMNLIIFNNCNPRVPSPLLTDKSTNQNLMSKRNKYIIIKPKGDKGLKEYFMSSLK